MTRNRKAELQRTLGMAPVAAPPPGLADRIKGEIPKSIGFTPERERAHLRHSVSFNLRIAASIVLLMSSLYFALHLFNRSSANEDAGTTANGRVASIPRPAIGVLPNTPPQPGSVHAQPASADRPALPSAPPDVITTAQLKDQASEKKREEASGSSAGSPAYVDSVETAAAPVPEPIIVADATPRSAPAEENRGFAPERAGAVSPMAKSSAASAAIPAAVAAPPPPPKQALPARESQPTRNFVAIEESIERGEQPRTADFAAIIRHFSAPERAPSALNVEIEASSAPLDDGKWLLRVSVDAPQAASAQVSILFGDAVTMHRLMTTAPAANETALYEIGFRGNAGPDQIIATVRAGGIERMLRVAELHRWSAATPRMKRVSLAAAWTRTLRSRANANAIVAKAREAHIDDLADLAEEAARIR